MDHLDGWFDVMAADYELPNDAAEELHDVGFVVIAGPVVQARLPGLVAAYDAALLAAHPDDVSIGRSTTRVHDFVKVVLSSMTSMSTDQSWRRVVASLVNRSS